MIPAALIDSSDLFTRAFMELNYRNKKHILIEKIITTGHAYVANSEVYYDINKFSDYVIKLNKSTFKP